MDSVGLVLAAVRRGPRLVGHSRGQPVRARRGFRLGRYQTTRGPGLYWLIPLIEWQRKVDMRILTADVEEQETITKDNVPIKVNAVVWYRIVDPRRATIDVKFVDVAVVQVALTTLRTGIGQHSLDEVLKEQEAVARSIQQHRRRGDRAVGRQGRAGRDEERRDPGVDAARHGAGSGSASRKARAR
jgi:hypothetical protein